MYEKQKTEYVSCSHPERISTKTHHIDINLSYGGRSDESCDWALTISRRTGRYADGNEVLEVFAWHYFKNRPWVWKMYSLAQWLRANGQLDTFLQVASKIDEMYAEMQGSLTWQRENILQKK